MLGWNIHILYPLLKHYLLFNRKDARVYIYKWYLQLINIKSLFTSQIINYILTYGIGRYGNTKKSN
jgi:hypothetical protein